MAISFIILFLFVCYAFYRPNRAVLACFPISLIFTTVPLVSFGQTNVGLNLVLYVIAIFIATISHSGQSLNSCPYIKPLLFFIICFVAIFFLGAYRSSVYPLISKIATYSFPLFLWKKLRTKDDIHYILCVFVLVSVLIGGYTLIECFSGSNLWMEWLQSQTSANIYVDHHDDIRFGFGRCNSFFHFPIPLGDYCAIIILFFLFWQLNSKQFIFRNRVKFIVFVLLMFISLLLSNSRAPIIALLLGLFFVDIFKSKKTFAFLLLGGLLGCIFAGGYIIQNLQSITGGGNENVGGSSMDMRQVQLLYCLNEFYKNPFFGAGFNRLMELQDESNRDLMGAESQAFYLLVEQGLLGIFAYIYGCVKMPTKFLIYGKKYFKFAIFFTFAWVAADMISLTTGLFITFPIILLLIVLRSIQLKIL